MAKKNQSEEQPTPKFEEGLAELQQIVQQLEAGQLGLDVALEKYQRGIEVLKQCHGVLKTTERKIELLSGVDAEGNPVTQPFEDEEMSLDEKAQSRAKRRGSSKKSEGKSSSDSVDDERKLFQNRMLQRNAARRPPDCHAAIAQIPHDDPGLRMAEVSTETFREVTERLRPEIDAGLNRLTEFDQDCPDRLREAIRYSLLAPGKRLRPVLALLAAEACGCEIQKAIAPACAVEMIHAYSLIHDDLPAMDDDDLRRGRPTCHRQFDEATAILAGDALLTRAFEVLATEIADAEQSRQCLRELTYAAGASQLVGGQVDDLRFEKLDGTADDLAAIHRRKTGAMITISLRLGGIVAGADEALLTLLTNYGDCLGLAFQITDDLLDVQGDEKSMGKRVGKDADKGKMTFPGVWGIEESRRKAEQLIHQACEAAAKLPSGGDSLISLAHYVLERNH